MKHLNRKSREKLLEKRFTFLLEFYSGLYEVLPEGVLSSLRETRYYLPRIMLCHSMTCFKLPNGASTYSMREISQLLNKHSSTVVHYKIRSRRMLFLKEQERSYLEKAQEALEKASLN